MLRRNIDSGLLILKTIRSHTVHWQYWARNATVNARSASIVSTHSSAPQTYVLGHIKLTQLTFARTKGRSLQRATADSPTGRRAADCSPWLRFR